MMYRSTRTSFVLAIVLLAGCAGSQGVEETPLQRAESSYEVTSYGYEAVMKSLVEVRAASKPDGTPYLTDAQWAHVETLQTTVRSVQPSVRSALDIWKLTGTEPANYGELSKMISQAIIDLQKMYLQVKR